MINVLVKHTYMKSNKELIETYTLSKKEFQKHSTIRSVWWDNFYKNSKKFQDENNLINFRKNQILSEGIDSDAKVLYNKISLIESLHLFNPDFLKKSLPTTNVGNSNYCIDYLGFCWDGGMIHQYKWVEEIPKYIFEKTKVICEIGGGFGGLARIIIKNYNTKYILIDLPEANLMSAYYLKEHFPEKRLFLYSDYLANPNKRKFDDFDIIILPPWCKFEKDIKIDFFINARSMMEMKISTIKNYFDLICTHISHGGFFLNINSYEKGVVGEKIRFHEYPYDNNWDVLISKTSFMQPQMHFLLTERKFDNFKNNITFEINKIKEIHKQKLKKLNFRNFSIKNYLKKITYRILKNTLLFVFGSKLKKIAKIIYHMPDHKN